MKLFVLVSRFPYPLEKGDKLRAFHQIRELSAQHEVHLACLSDQPVKEEWQNEVRKYCASLHIFNLNKAFIYLNTAKQFFTEKPYQVGYFYQGAIQRRINQLIEKIQPDHIYCQLIRTAEYVKHIQHIPKTIDYMDALAKGMMRRAEISGGIRKRLFKSEAKRLGAYENRIFDYFNHHTIISEQDRKFIQHPSAQKIVVIENGIGDEFLNYQYTAEKKYDLVFVGNLNYAPNIEGAEFLANEIVPALKKLGLEPKILISGANPHARILSLASSQIEVRGWVKDIRESYCSGRIFIAPLFIGTGLQNKLLEAMALGLPCITTGLVNNALGAAENEVLLLAENATEFAKKTALLLASKSESERISAAGKHYVTTTFSWKKSVEKLSLLLGSSQIR
ncbi:MAG: glycosyltransferase [Bacteroidetes bacterium]|nr:glycosyltransferase [Bacteroidota bacterium]